MAACLQGRPVTLASLSIPSASAVRGAGITKVAEALAVPVAIVFARLISSTVSCLKCGNVQSTPFLHCSFRKKRQ
jgi:hypothetical protein